jgi:hypothetical protein
LDFQVTGIRGQDSPVARLVTVFNPMGADLPIASSSVGALRCLDDGRHASRDAAWMRGVVPQLRSATRRPR